MYLYWSTDKEILESINKIGITQAFGIIDTIFHDPIKRIQKRTQFFNVLKENNLQFLEHFNLFDKRFESWKSVMNLWN